MTALITPFHDDGSVDESTFRALAQRQVDAGIHGLVPCGTTGETPTLTDAEWERCIQICIEVSGGAVPVIAGTGTNHTATTVANSVRARDLGVQAVLVAAPPYNKPTQEGLFQHYAAVAQAVPDCHVVIYDVPGRSAVAVAAETTARLTATFSNIVAVKDATADLAKAAELFRSVPATVSLLSGDDFTFLPFLAAGGAGCVSVASNLIPERMVALHALWSSGNIKDAAAESARLQPFFRALFVQTNPLPIKTAMADSGLCGASFRLPLCPMDDGPKASLLQAVADLADSALA
ncbi:MAG: 4-hydroxy-tetrahydrodipicolinate synthase [Myxococcota bacterium]